MDAFLFNWVENYILTGREGDGGVSNEIQGFDRHCFGNLLPPGTVRGCNYCMQIL